MTGKTGQQIAKLSQFHLDFSLATVCTPRKDVEDQLSPVDHFHIGYFGNGARLSRSEVLIENQDISAALQCFDDDFFQLPLAEQEAVIFILDSLDDLIDDRDFRGDSQLASSSRCSSCSARLWVRR